MSTYPIRYVSLRLPVFVDGPAASCRFCGAIEEMGGSDGMVLLHAELKERGIAMRELACCHISIPDYLDPSNRLRIRVAQQDRRLWTLVMADQLRSGDAL